MKESFKQSEKSTFSFPSYVELQISVSSGSNDDVIRVPFKRTKIHYSDTLKLLQRPQSASTFPEALEENYIYENDVFLKRTMLLKKLSYPFNLKKYYDFRVIS